MSQQNSGTAQASESSGRIAWVAGASGLIGRSLVQQLCDSQEYDHVYAFVRKASADDFQHSKLKYFICDWEKLLDGIQMPLPSECVDSAFCALGSTTRKTPDKASYRRIDVDYPTAFAQLAKRHGARFYGLVSAHGADSRLPSFYLSMKRDVEASVRAADIASTAFARPSLLLGEREEFRLAESASEWICKLLPGNYKAIDARHVAAALIRESLSNEAGCRILESGQMQGAAGS